jgi:hypothetical protein
LFKGFFMWLWGHYNTGSVRRQVYWLFSIDV